MTLRRDTRDRLWRELLLRGAVPRDKRSLRFDLLLHWVTTLFFILSTLYLFAHL